MFYDIFSVTDFTFCYVGPSGKYNVVKFFKNPEDWDLGPGTLDLGPWTWDHCLSGCIFSESGTIFNPHYGCA